MKRILILTLALIFTFSLTFAQAPVEKSSKKPAVTTETKTVAKTTVPKGYKAMKGVVVNLLSAVDNPKAPALTKDEAVQLVNRGEHIAFRVGNKLYIVVMADGISADKKLANKADKTVELVGKVSSRGGISLLIVDKL